VAILRVRQTRRLQARGSAGSHSSFFCAAARAEGPRDCQAGKGTFAFLSAGVAEEFSLKARHRELTIKRGEGRPVVSLDDLLARERTDQEPAHKLSADRIYERRWALTLLEQVLARLGAEYEAAGKLPLFDRLKELLARESGQPSQGEIAAEMQMTENAVKQAFHRMRHRYRQLLHEEIAHTVAVSDDVEDELRHFISVLQT